MCIIQTRQISSRGCQHWPEKPCSEDDDGREKEHKSQAPSYQLLSNCCSKSVRVEKKDSPMPFLFLLLLYLAPFLKISFSIIILKKNILEYYH